MDRPLPGTDRRSAAVLGATAALSCVPVFVDLLLSWRHAPFRYFASDSYYYLTIARNIAEAGRVSFDGQHPTNGFHPLWQLLLAALDKACLLLSLDELTFCYLVVIVGISLVTLALTLVGRTIWRARGGLSAVFVLVPVGLYGLLVAPIWFVAQDVRHGSSPAEGQMPLHGTAWSYANGMESGLALAAWALLLARATGVREMSARSAGILGGLGAFVVLARLDQVFAAVPILGLIAARWIAAERRRAWRPVFIMGAAFFLPVGIYLLVNLWYCGMAFPVSGAAKLSLRSIGRSNLESLGVLFRAGIGTPFWLDRFYRLAQMLVPAAAAVAFLLEYLRRWRRERDGLSDALAATATGVLALCAFVFLFTDARSYGSWSLPVPVLFVSLSVLGLLKSSAPLPRFALSLAAGCAAVIVVFLALHRRLDYHERYRLMYARRDAIVSFYGANQPRLIEVDDGIVAFATRFPALSGLGFAADKELHDALSEGRLLSLARARGYDRIGSLMYLPIGMGPEAALRDLAAMYRDESGTATFALEYYDATLPLAVVRIVYPPTPR